MRYKGFYIKISPDINISRVDKNGRDVLCEGFLIQVFADETAFLRLWGLRYWRTALRRRNSLPRILLIVRGRNI